MIIDIKEMTRDELIGYIRNLRPLCHNCDYFGKDRFKEICRVCYMDYSTWKHRQK